MWRRAKAASWRVNAPCRMSFALRGERSSAVWRLSVWQQQFAVALVIITLDKCSLAKPISLGFRGSPDVYVTATVTGVFLRLRQCGGAEHIVVQTRPKGSAFLIFCFKAFILLLVSDLMGNTGKMER